jgi:hypothetical protein
MRAQGAGCLGVCADLCSLKDFLFPFKAFSVFLIECVASAFLPLYFFVQLVSGSVATRSERLSIGAITHEPECPCCCCLTAAHAQEFLATSCDPIKFPHIFPLTRKVPQVRSLRFKWEITISYSAFCLPHRKGWLSGESRAGRMCLPRLDFSYSCSSIFAHVVCESLQGEIGIALESPDQKTRGFMVKIALSW